MKPTIVFRWLLTVVGFFTLLPSYASYVLVSSVEEITSGARYLIALQPTLNEGVIMGNYFEEDYKERLKSIELPVAPADYITWEIAVTDSEADHVYYTIQRNDNYIGVKASTGTALVVGKNTEWLITASEDGGFLIRNKLTQDRSLAATNQSTKEWANYKGDYPVYLFKEVSVSAPEFSAQPTLFDELITVTLTATDGNKIYYTTDGTTPTAASQLYTAPISIEGVTTTIKAIAVEDDGTASGVVEQTYTYCPPISVFVGGQDHLGTLYSAYPVALPENAIAWLITGKDDATATLQLKRYADAAGSILPAEVPYLIQGVSSESPLTFSLSLPDVSDTPVDAPEYASDLFKGTAECVAPPANMMILGLGYNRDKTEFGFYPFVGEYIAANRAFLVFPKGATYRLITSMDNFKSDAQYIIVTANNDGQPGGYYAGAFSGDKLSAFQFTDEEPYFWTFSRVGSQDEVRIKGEDDKGIEFENSGTSLRQSTTLSIQPWPISFDDDGHCILGSGSRSLQFSDFYKYFKYYSTLETKPYLFIKEEVDVSAHAAGYVLRLDAPTGISGLKVAPSAGAIYDMQGRRLNERPARGMYIENGVKRLAQ